jgi:RNB domain/Dis3-like cold-shock domain 2 (CSD2)/Rrp44-like cold shock domain
VGGVLRSGTGAGAGNQQDALGKIRVRERYWRPRRSATTTATSTAVTHDADHPRQETWILLLDAASWRTYLPLVHKLLMMTAGSSVGGGGDTVSSSSSSSTTSINGTSPKFEFVLLESTAELMDERNRAKVEDAGSTSVDSGGGGGRVSERNALLRLVQRKQVRAFPDLSVREVDDGGGGVDDEGDEWNWLSYEDMTVDDRAMHAMVRAGRMLLGSSATATSSSSSSISLRVGLVVSDDNYATYLTNVPMDDGMCVLDGEEMLRLLVKGDDEAAHATLTRLAASCREAYDERRRRRIQKARRVGLDSTPLEGEGSQADEGLTPEQIQAGVRDGRLKRGRLEVSKDNPREAFVATKTGTYLVDPKGRSNIVRAFHHDVVIVRELPQSKWGRPCKRIVHQRDEDDDDISPEGDNDNAAGIATDPPIPTAAVVSIEKASRRIFVATMLDPLRDTDSHALLVPMDVRIPKIRVPAKAYYANRRLKVQVDAWDNDSNYPSGRCIDVIGPAGDLETEVASLLIENKVNLEPFSTAALACLPAAGDKWTIPPGEVRKRNDLRDSRLIFSVDPPGCQDIDDSMHAHVLPTGDVEVGVHIADVTQLVRHNSPLDLEAQARGTTFYLVDRRYDMLPSLLSSNLCSLHGHTDRLAVSVIWTLSPDLKTVKSTWFGRTVIHNRAGT